MKRRNNGIVLLFAAVAAFTSCAKEELDNEKPVIVLTSPAEEEAVRPGSAIHFEVTLSDNEALASYKVEVHSAFDGHGHSTSAATVTGSSPLVAGDATIGSGGATTGVDAATTGTGDATTLAGYTTTRTTETAQPFERTWLESDFIALGEEPIAGKRSVTLQHSHILIPDSIGGRSVQEGHYHFILYCTDAAGQESSFTREILISYDAEGY